MDRTQRIVIAVAVIFTFVWLMYANHQEALRQAELEKERQKEYEEYNRRLAEQLDSEGEPATTGRDALPRIADATDPADPADRDAPDVGDPETTDIDEPGDTTLSGADDADVPVEDDYVPPEEVHDAVVMRSPGAEAVFTSRGAALRRWTFLDFHRTSEGETPLVLLDELVPGRTHFRILSVNGDGGVSTRNWELVESPEGALGLSVPKRLTFRTRFRGWRITRVYAFSDPSAQPRVLDVRTIFENTTGRSRPLSWKMSGPVGVVPDDTNARFGALSAIVTVHDGEETEITRTLAPSLEDEPPLSDKRGDIAWVGLKNRFFLAALRFVDPDRTAEVTARYLTASEQYLADHPRAAEAFAASPANAAFEWRSRETEVPADRTTLHEAFFYGGPLQQERLAFDPSFSGAVTYAWSSLDFISSRLVWLLSKLYLVFGNYGVCIIFLTILIKSAMHGLTRKALVSGHKMQKIQPLMQEIKKKYEKDQAKQQQEMMRLWREHGVSPWGSCLPMLVQIPVFIALWGAFAYDFTMRQATFIPGWIDDLSQPDHLFDLPFVMPFFGWTRFNLLPILYVGLQLVQMSMTPKSADPTVQQQQKMMKIMPVVFMVIFYTMPSGLILYFTVSAAYTLAEHWIIRRKLDEGDGGGASGGGSDDGAAPAAAGQGFGGKKRKKK